MTRTNQRRQDIIYRNTVRQLGLEEDGGSFEQNTQIHKYTPHLNRNTQIQKYTNTKIYKFKGTKYISARVHKHVNNTHTASRSTSWPRGLPWTTTIILGTIQLLQKHYNVPSYSILLQKAVIVIVKHDFEMKRAQSNRPLVRVYPLRSPYCLQLTQWSYPIVIVVIIWCLTKLLFFGYYCTV